LRVYLINPFKYVSYGYVKMSRAALIIISASIIIALVIPLATYLLYPEEVQFMEDVVERVFSEHTPYIHESPKFVKGITIVTLRKNPFSGRGYVTVDPVRGVTFIYDGVPVNVIMGRSYVDNSTGRIVSGDMLIHLISNSSGVRGYLIETPRGRVLVLVEVVVDGRRFVLWR